MKKYLILLAIFSVFCCQTAKVTPDYDFKYHEYSYVDSEVVWEIIYDSKTGIYEEKIKEKVEDNYKVDSMTVKLKEEDLKEIYKKYVTLGKFTPNKCIYNKKNGELLYKSAFRFYSNENQPEDKNCNISIENKTFNSMWSIVFEKIQSSSSYKNTFPEIGR